MSWAVARAVTLALAAGAVLVAVAQLAPERRPAAEAVWLLLLGALALQLAVRWVRVAYPRPGRSAFDAALTARPARQPLPTQLDGLVRALALSEASGLYARSQLGARLRPVAADRLAWYRGVDLDRRPERAAAALGAAAWSLVGPDPDPPPDRDAPGVPAATLAAAVDGIERVADG